jgi:hypothetical protein
MKFRAIRNAAIAASFILGGMFSSVAQIEVSFADVGQTVDETHTVTIVIELSEPSLLEVEVPYVISGDSTAVLNTDYEIPEETDNFENESPIVFEPGETEKTITITLLNDDNDEDDEFIYIDLVQNGLTNVVLGEITRHTVRIIDNDVIEVYFPRHTLEYSEGEDILVPFRLTSISEQDIEVAYSISYGTANANDLDLNDSFNSPNPITIVAGGIGANIAIKINNESVTDRNEGGADRETIRVSLTSARLGVSNTAILVEDQPCEITIVDNDPLRVTIEQINVSNLSLRGANHFPDDSDFELPIEVEEFSTVQIIVRLLDEEGDPSETGAEIQIPVNYGGAASLGSSDTDDYDGTTDPLTIASGSSTASWTLTMTNDDTVEGDEAFNVSIGAPFYTNGGDIQLGEHTNLSFVIKDNDPVTLNFGAIYTRDDEEADENDDVDDILYVESSGSVVAEKTGLIQIPYFLSSLSDQDVQFDLEISESGTTATILGPNDKIDDEGWDFRDASTGYTPIERLGRSERVTINAGTQAGVINVALRLDDQDPIIFGEDAPADLEPDENVVFTMSNVNTSSSSVTIGNANSYNLTIRDLEDIDITALFDGTSPDPQFLENGNLPFDPRTGLFQAVYNLRPNTTFDPNQFVGYKSLKIQYRTSNYDAANPSAEGNDPLIQEPSDPNPEEEFHFYVQTPFQLRYPHAIENIILAEGAEAVDNRYSIATADTIERAPYLVRPLNLPPLNDFEALRDDAYDLNDTLNWTVDFYSLGSFTFPSERIDPASNPDRMRIYLSALNSSTTPSTGTSMTVDQFHPQTDGSMLIVFNVSTASRVQIQYLDPGPDAQWKIAYPQIIATGSASQLYWLDKGPPATDSHPSTVDFRLYRIINLN